MLILWLIGFMFTVGMCEDELNECETIEIVKGLLICAAIWPALLGAGMYRANTQGGNDGNSDSHVQ